MGATGAADEMLAEKRTPGGEPLVVKRREFKAFKGLRAKPPEPFPPAARPVESATEVAAPSAVDSAQDDEIYENLDPGALDPSALGADDGVEHAIGESTAADPSAVDRWNSPGLVTDLSEQLPGEDFGAVDAERSRLRPHARSSSAARVMSRSSPRSKIRSRRKQRWQRLPPGVSRECPMPRKRRMC
jgi:hypothetical protein